MAQLQELIRALHLPHWGNHVWNRPQTLPSKHGPSSSGSLQDDVPQTTTMSHTIKGQAQVKGWAQALGWDQQSE